MAQLLHMDFHQRIAKHLGTAPRLHPTAFTAANATIVGDVTLGEESSVWYQCVLRADIHRIVIGPRTNIQDGAIVHLADEFGSCAGAFSGADRAASRHADRESRDWDFMWPP